MKKFICIQIKKPGDFPDKELLDYDTKQERDDMARYLTKKGYKCYTCLLIGEVVDGEPIINEVEYSEADVSELIVRVKEAPVAVIE